VRQAVKLLVLGDVVVYRTQILPDQWVVLRGVDFDYRATSCGHRPCVDLMFGTQHPGGSLGCAEKLSVAVAEARALLTGSLGALLVVVGLDLGDGGRGEETPLILVGVEVRPGLRGSRHIIPRLRSEALFGPPTVQVVARRSTTPLNRYRPNLPRRLLGKHLPITSSLPRPRIITKSLLTPHHNRPARFILRPHLRHLRIQHHFNIMQTVTELYS